jgi:hypothetical protein
MKRTILALLTVFILAHAPWYLLALGVQTLWMNPGHTQFSTEDDAYWDALRLEARLIDLGWAVNYSHDLNSGGQAAYGLTSQSEHTVWIDQSMHWNARFAVLAHEGGHILQPGWMTREQGEIFAETVSALVSRDGLREHARYLSRYKLDFMLITFMEWRQIYRAAAVLRD